MISIPPVTHIDACLHLALAVVSPFQSFMDKPGITHEFCNYQALAILKNDGFTEYSDFLANYMAEINAGVYWADKDWKNVHHYFEPDSRQGLWHCTHALDNFEMFYHLACQAVKQGNLEKAAFFLGAAAHLTQDLCVPHHARAKLFNGHKQYEHWVQAHYQYYAATINGTYSAGLPPQSLLLKNASIAADLFDLVKYEGDEQLYNKATEILLPLAQRTTAGLFRAFVSEFFSTLPQHSQ